jgi:hypothetical protein
MVISNMAGVRYEERACRSLLESLRPTCHARGLKAKAHYCYLSLFSS